ncbi:MAG TPA: transcriptional repressor [Candidatus Xenobia bacterium]|jgi:Fur family ferric uptake transcriptional regulator
MREKEVFYQFLATKGLKRTAQRDDILDLFLATESHQSAEAMYHVLKEKNSGIGFSTVYRTLKLLKECGLAREVNFADGRAYFEHDFEHPHHDHLVCLGCGDTIEFFNETIEALQDKVAAESEFTPVRHSMVIFGYCRDCHTTRSDA